MDASSNRSWASLISSLGGLRISAAGYPEPPDRLPTLTEVVELPPEREMPAAEPAIDEAALTARILAAVQQKIDLMLEYRLREALTPSLARAADQVIRDAREELAATLRDVVERAVAQEAARRRSR